MSDTNKFILFFFSWFAIVLIGVHLIPEPIGPPIDEETGYPIIGLLSQPACDLPDGHYSVHRVGMHRSCMMVILHEAGPCRDFIYNISLHYKTGIAPRKAFEVINDLNAGSRFRIFQGQVYLS